MTIYDQIIVVAFNSINELRELRIFENSDRKAANDFLNECQKYDHAFMDDAAPFGKALLIGYKVANAPLTQYHGLSTFWAIIDKDVFDIECCKIHADNLKDALAIVQTFKKPTVIIIDTHTQQIVWKSNLYDKQQHEVSFQMFLETFKNK